MVVLVVGATKQDGATIYICVRAHFLFPNLLIFFAWFLSVSGDHDVLDSSDTKLLAQELEPYLR